ncbi:hypothetical protein [Escherichia phage fp01]|uniref:Uncharacterized protein n=1 Tax=Escherichia phage fp01 TaxID=2315695 RepID=A0A6C1FFN4_9CAUD|nr:hypothetical protein HWB87_gp120 [Escherichia phage fp01]QIE02406.1 hypothetical protein [Escherichia phage fp01]
MIGWLKTLLRSGAFQAAYFRLNKSLTNAKLKNSWKRS